MIKLLIFLQLVTFLVLSIQAQDLTYAKEIVKTLASEEFDEHMKKQRGGRKIRATYIFYEN